MRLVGLCFNWKVLAGLAVVVAAVLMIRPGLLVVAVPLALLLSCPLSCLFMMRGMRGRQAEQSSLEAGVDQPPAEEQRIAKLGEDLAALRAECEQTFEVSSRLADSRAEPSARKPTVPAN